MTVEEVRGGDEPLVAAARAGDQAAFSELVRRHQDEVFTLALRLTADREAAADIATGGLRACMASPLRIPRRCPLLHLAASHHRQHRLDEPPPSARHRAESIDELATEPVAAGPSPETVAESADLRPRLLAALDALPEGNRVVVVLKDVYGWSHGEIAEHLGISLSAAKVRLHRGRSRLRRSLFDRRPAGGAS